MLSNCVVLSESKRPYQLGSKAPPQGGSGYVWAPTESITCPSEETVPMTASDSHAMNSALSPLLRQLTLELLDGKLYFDNYGSEAFYMRTLLAIGALQNYYREELSSRKPPLLKDLIALVDQFKSCGMRDSRIEAFLRTSIRELESADAGETMQRAGWENEVVPRAVSTMPTMLCPETMAYYKWLARTFSGVG